MAYKITVRPQNGRTVKFGAGTKSRTRDPLITSQVLYQLSYTGKEVGIMPISSHLGKYFKTKLLTKL